MSRTAGPAPNACSLCCNLLYCRSAPCRPCLCRRSKWLVFPVQASVVRKSSGDCFFGLSRWANVTATPWCSCAFVTFDSEEAKEQALRLDGTSILSRQLKVRRAAHVGTAHMLQFIIFSAFVFCSGVSDIGIAFHFSLAFSGDPA